MLGQQPDTLLPDKSDHNQIQIPFVISQPLQHLIPPAAEPTEFAQSDFICEWNNCKQDLLNLKSLVLHVNEHIDSTFDEDGICKWNNCWNKHDFQHKTRLMGTL
jgi:hypothetical protein